MAARPGAAIVVGWLVIGLAAPLLTIVDPLKTKSFIIDGTHTLPPPFDPGTSATRSARTPAAICPGRGHVRRARHTQRRVVVLLARLVRRRHAGAIAGVARGTADEPRRVRGDRRVRCFPDDPLRAPLVDLAFDIRSGLSAFALALAITGWWGFGRATRCRPRSWRCRAGRSWARRGARWVLRFALFVGQVMPNLLPILAVSAASAGQRDPPRARGAGIARHRGRRRLLYPGRRSQPRRWKLLPSSRTAEWGAILAGGGFAVYSRRHGSRSCRRPRSRARYSDSTSSATDCARCSIGRRCAREDPPLAQRSTFVATAVLAIRLVTPMIGPAAGYVSLARSFDADRAGAHVAYCADPARAGRFSGSAGYQASAQYMADRFKEIGLTPMGEDGSVLPALQADGRAPDRDADARSRGTECQELRRAEGLHRTGRRQGGRRHGRGEHRLCGRWWIETPTTATTRGRIPRATSC